MPEFEPLEISGARHVAKAWNIAAFYCSLCDEVDADEGACEMADLQNLFDEAPDADFLAADKIKGADRIMFRFKNGDWVEMEKPT